MSTLTANNTFRKEQSKVKEVKVDLLTEKFGDLESKRFGIIPVALIWTICWGSVAVGLGAMLSPVLLVMLVVPTMLLLSFCLAVQPIKSILWIGIVTTLIDWGVIVSLLV